MADSKKYNGSTWQHSLRKYGTDTDTFITIPATIIADGTNASVGLKGNMSQSGTPTHDNPIQPQETGERTGNLFDEDYTGIGGSIKYVPVYVGNGSFTLSTSCPVIERAAALFFLTGNAQSGASTNSNGVYKNRPITVASSDGYVTVAYRYVSYTTGSADPRNEKTMLNTGSTALPYEPYGIKIPISSANTTTPLYLGEVETTRRVKKLVLTGEENDWRTSGDGAAQIFNHTIGLYADLQPYAICNMFYQTNNAAGYNNSFDIVRSSGNGVIRFNNSGIASTTADWKAYLAAQYAAGTPVCVWYVLSEPTTGIVNEPLRKIGDYADTVSYEQAGVQIPTLHGNTVIDVNTTLKPFEIEIEYTGWHDANVKAWDGDSWE